MAWNPFPSGGLLTQEQEGNSTSNGLLGAAAALLKSGGWSDRPVSAFAQLGQGLDGFLTGYNKNSHEQLQNQLMKAHADKFKSDAADKENERRLNQEWATNVLGPNGVQTAGAPGAGGPMAAYRHAISAVESRGSGDYAAIGPPANGGRAIGRYQVMDYNVGPWTEKYLGKRMTPQEFLASPEAQDKVFDGEFGHYVAKTGNPQDAASMWFSGKPRAAAGNANDGYTTVPGYITKFNAGLADYQKQAQAQPQPQPQPQAPQAPQQPGGLLTQPGQAPQGAPQGGIMPASLLSPQPMAQQPPPDAPMPAALPRMDTRREARSSAEGGVANVLATMPLAQRQIIALAGPTKGREMIAAYVGKQAEKPSDTFLTVRNADGSMKSHRADSPELDQALARGGMVVTTPKGDDSEKKPDNYTLSNGQTVLSSNGRTYRDATGVEQRLPFNAIKLGADTAYESSRRATVEARAQNELDNADKAGAARPPAESAAVKGTGPWAGLAAATDAVAGGLGIPQAFGKTGTFPETTANRAYLRNIKQVGKTALVNNPRFPVAEQHTVDELFPQADTFWANPHTEAQKIPILRNMMNENLRMNNEAIAGGGLDKTEMSKLASNNIETKRALRLLGPGDASLGALGKPDATKPAAGAPGAAAAAQGAPPTAAAHLKSNPGLAAAYDAKYGAGEAAKILGAQ